MAIVGAGELIRAAAVSWPGVTARPHRFGGLEYVLSERREIGHVHGNSLVDIPLPRRLRDGAIAAGRAVPHHIMPDSGWVSIYLRAPGDVEAGIKLLRGSLRSRDAADAAGE